MRITTQPIDGIEELDGREIWYEGPVVYYWSVQSDTHGPWWQLDKVDLSACTFTPAVTDEQRQRIEAELMHDDCVGPPDDYPGVPDC